MPGSPGGPARVRVHVRVPGKVNLHLGVGAVRADGYHELTTVFQALSVYDDVLATSAPDLAVTTLGAEAAVVPTGPGNLAWQAATLLAQWAERPATGHLEITKTIPVAGGMAGGSADAAASLLACAQLWGVPVTTADLLELASRLGSDVAFPVLGGTALGHGRGERLTPVTVLQHYYWALAIAEGGLSAGDAYRELDRLRAAGRAAPPLPPPDALVAALRAGDVAGVAVNLGNDLQEAVLSIRPALADVLAAGLDAGAVAALISGSGPTCAFLCSDAPAAASLAAVLDASGLCRGTRQAHSVAVGAHVVPSD